MSIKEELDELFLDPKERWIQHLENLRDDFDNINTEEDFVGTTIFSPLYPDIIKDLTHELRDRYGLKARLSEYATADMGFSCLYNDMKNNNIIWQTAIIKKIERAFSSQKVVNVKFPDLDIRSIKQTPSNKHKVYSHLEKRQYGKAQDLSDRLNVSIGDLSLIYHVYAFNHAFYNNSFSELYQLYTADNGFLNNIKKSIQSFGKEADGYIRKILSYCEEELDIECYRNTKKYRNSEENVKAQRQIIKEMMEYSSTVPIPI